MEDILLLQHSHVTSACVIDLLFHERHKISIPGKPLNLLDLKAVLRFRLRGKGANTHIHIHIRFYILPPYHAYNVRNGYTVCSDNTYRKHWTVLSGKANPGPRRCRWSYLVHNTQRHRLKPHIKIALGQWDSFLYSSNNNPTRKYHRRRIKKRLWFQLHHRSGLQLQCHDVRARRRQLNHICHRGRRGS